MDIIKTRRGVRMSQHGVVITELRTTAGPTDSIADMLAALISVLRPSGRVGVLGFAGGGMQAPLAALGVETKVHAVDLDRAGYDLFRAHCPAWVSRVQWTKADAVTWLRKQPADFGLLVEDLSVPCDDDVFKPAVSWSVLPELIRARLATNGVAVFNLLPPPGGIWLRELDRVVSLFREARLVSFDEFANHILVAGDTIPGARALGGELRSALRSIGSRLADTIHLRTAQTGCGTEKDFPQRL